MATRWGTFTAAGSALASSAGYDPLGAVLATSGTRSAIGYQGAWTDQGSGKANMAARWYDPASGQFTSRDTVSNSPNPASANANTYGYANANPLTGTDPSGHITSDWGGSGGGEVGSDGGGGGVGTLDPIDPEMIATGEALANEIEDYLVGFAPSPGDPKTNPSPPVTRDQIQSEISALKAAKTPVEVQNLIDRLKAQLQAVTAAADPGPGSGADDGGSGSCSGKACGGQGLGSGVGGSNGAMGGGANAGQGAGPCTFNCTPPPPNYHKKKAATPTRPKPSDPGDGSGVASSIEVTVIVVTDTVISLLDGSASFVPADAATSSDASGLADGGVGASSRCGGFVPDGYQCTADGNLLNTRTGQTICAQGGEPACWHAADPDVFERLDSTRLRLMGSLGKNGRPGTVSEMWVPMGSDALAIFTGMAGVVSNESVAPSLKALLDMIRHPHGGCSEIDCVNQAIQDGLSARGDHHYHGCLLLSGGVEMGRCYNGAVSGMSAVAWRSWNTIDWWMI